MEHVLYRKYRPRTFKDAVGQEHVTNTLQQALKSGRISHAYLFTGPRGVGKTSVARILAYEVNQLPYNADTVHLDIIEIDAASNRRIDEIRDLRDKVRTAPALAKFKVYIIDEVHMLTREAFNALLKTLEEPPAHCIFILATTEAHKLPDTIISRTQRFEFKPVSAPKVAQHLSTIAKKEKIDITTEAIELLADFGEGSFRDSISYLDQLSTMNRTITAEEVRRILGMPPQQDVETLVAAMQKGNAAEVMSAIQKTKEQGTGAAELAAAISKKLRQIMVEGQSGPVESKLVKELINVSASLKPYELLEIVLLDAAAENRASVDKTDTKKLDDKKDHQTPTGGHGTQSSSQPAPPKIRSSVPGHFRIEQWPEIVQNSRSRAASLYTALRLAKPQVSDDTLTLKFQFPLHKKKVELAKNKALLSELIEELTGQKPVILCEVDKIQPPHEVRKDHEVRTNTDSISSITTIFGPAEMLEA
jgi:DNA polymerase III subunit gamma/tau